MTCNKEYEHLIGWYFISSCECGDTAIDAIKKKLIKQTNKKNFKIALYPFMFYRKDALDIDNCGAIKCNDIINNESKSIGCPRINDKGKWCKQPISSCLNTNLGYWIYVMCVNPTCSDFELEIQTSESTIESQHDSHMC